MNFLRIRAPWVLPIASPPISNGAVLLNSAGRIEAVGPDISVPRPEGGENADLTGAAVLPGLVNIHTHLELNALGGPIKRPSFYEWIQFVKTAKEELGNDQLATGAKRGVLQCWRFGVTTVADTGDTGAAVSALTEMGGSGVVYQEVFGPHPDQAEESAGWLRKRVEVLQDAAGPRVRIGVSPHAVYSVSASLYREVAGVAGTDIPVAMHLAESEAESELVRDGAGPFADMWTQRRIPPIERARSPVEFVRRTGIMDTAPLVIHAIRVDQADIALLAAAGARIAACPVSNRIHGHGDPPVRLWHENGVSVGLGTDSVVSVGDLDMFREAAAYQSLCPGTPTEGLERMTVHGAEALGLENELGTLRAGHWGDLCVVDIGHIEENPATAVVGRGREGILRTYVGGRCVYARDTDGAGDT